MFDENESYDDEMQETHECDWDCYGRHSGYPCELINECENINKYDGAAVAVLFVIIIFILGAIVASPLIFIFHWFITRFF